MSGPGEDRTHISLAYEASAFTNLATGPISSVAWTRTTPLAYETRMQPLHFNAVYKRS